MWAYPPPELLPQSVVHETSRRRFSPLLEPLTSTESRGHAWCGTHPDERGLLQSVVDNQNAFVALAVENNGVAAFLACVLIAGEVHVEMIATSPGRQKRGIATRLLSNMLAQFGCAPHSPVCSVIILYKHLTQLYTEPASFVCACCPIC